MAIHHFCTEDAAQYGIEEAILLWNIGFWCATNLAKRQHIHDGNVWTYNPHKAFLEFTPYICPRNPSLDTAEYPDEKSRKKAEEKELNRRTQKIKRLFKSLENQGAIVVGNYNKQKYDRTSWYALADPQTLSKYSEICPQALQDLIVQKCTLDSTKMSDGQYENVRPIPDSKPNHKPAITTTTTTQTTKISLESFVEGVIDSMTGSTVPEWFIVQHASDLWSDYKNPRTALVIKIILDDWKAVNAQPKPQPRLIQ